MCAGACARFGVAFSAPTSWAKACTTGHGPKSPRTKNPSTIVPAVVRFIARTPLPSMPRRLAHRGREVNARPCCPDRTFRYNRPMTDPAASDPLDWRDVKAPSLDEIEVIAIEAFRRLPTKFCALCEDLVIRVEDFPTDE